MNTTTVKNTLRNYRYNKIKQTFYTEVLQGLSASPKYLDSKYFYDAHGDLLFQQIMHCPEYYLTNCEMEILTQQTDAIVDALKTHTNGFDIVELGAGDATKSFHLLEQLLQAGIHYTYFPIDISENVITTLAQQLPQKLPQLQMHGLRGEYFDMLQEASELSGRNKVVLFMGANIGNFTIETAREFCMQLRTYLQPGDLLLTGFDLKKNPQQILNAYNDKQGITKAFNLNLLQRINRELGADFNSYNFDHYPTYDPLTGACKSYLVSLVKQQVHIGEETIDFKENEIIYMEISQKYSLEETDRLAAVTGFTPIDQFLDKKGWFVDCLWKCS
jgi:L-histidine N-alpha-methyltransferase